MSIPRLVVMFVLSVIVLGAFISPAEAQETDRDLVAKAGVGAHPGQGWLGVHFDWRELRNKIMIRPGAEVGFGDKLTLMSLNGDAVYVLRDPARVWRPFVGGGPAFVARAFRGNQGDSGVGPGFNFIGGIKERKGLVIEVRAGLMDSARFRVGLGWTF